MIQADLKKKYSTAAFVLAAAIVVLTAGLYLYNIVKWKDYPDFGYLFHAATGIEVVGSVTENGRRAGLNIGDRFISVNGKTFVTIEDFRAAMHRELGQQNRYLLERGGKQFEMVISNIPLGFKRAFLSSGLPFLLGLCYASIGFLVFLMKPHQRPSWIFFLFTAILGIFIVFLHKKTELQPLLLENILICAYTFCPAVFIQLASCFPKERELVKRYPQAQFIPYIISLLLAVRILSVTPTIFDAPKIWLIVVMAYLACGIVIFLGSCLQLRLSSASEIIKLRSQIILIGFGIAASLPIVDAVIRTLFRVNIVPDARYYLPFLIFIPIFVGYSIVKHDLFDIDAIIKRTYGYLLTTGTIAGIYGIIVLVSNLAFGGFEFAKSPVFPLVFILAVVFLFNPIRNRVQRVIDRVFYRLEYDYQETVGKIGETMRSLLNLDEIGKSIMHFALQPMFVDAGAVMVINKENKSYDCLIQSGDPEQKKNDRGAAEFEKKDAAEKPPAVQLQTLAFDEPFISKMAEWKKTVTIYDIWEDPFFDDNRYECIKTLEQFGATLVVPLIYEDQLTGVISLGRKKSGKFYRREDINLLNTLANQSAVAIENARMVDEVVEKERMEEELNIARDLQVSMLPSETPQVAGFEIAAYSVSAREVGGDFYDFIEMGDDRAGMIVGDVTGKSVSGALVMSASRSVFRMLSEEKLNVSDSMIRANRRLKKDVKTGMFVALLYAVLNAEDKTLTMCSAGQTQPIHRLAETGETSLIETRGDTFPLGILDDAAYEETRLELSPGDKVILYTDGIVEAMNTDEEMFGFERLLEVVQTSASTTADALLNEIIGSVSEFAGATPQHDDLTVIVVSYNK